MLRGYSKTESIVHSSVDRTMEDEMNEFHGDLGTSRHATNDDTPNDRNDRTIPWTSFLVLTFFTIAIINHSCLVCWLTKAN
mmetsp:Transcript_26502/g.56944  ORF Transcript_26502/g.56944 Transcript_26502/m.56944 type:complete len:81 (-) Transcript_26502:938-1180(-)